MKGRVHKGCLLISGVAAFVSESDFLDPRFDVLVAVFAALVGLAFRVADAVWDGVEQPPAANHWLHML